LTFALEAWSKRWTISKARTELPRPQVRRVGHKEGVRSLSHQLKFAEQDLRYQLEAATEEKIFAVSELDENKIESQELEQRLRDEISELQSELVAQQSRPSDTAAASPDQSGNSGQDKGDKAELLATLEAEVRELTERLTDEEEKNVCLTRDVAQMNEDLLERSQDQAAAPGDDEAARASEEMQSSIGKHMSEIAELTATAKKLETHNTELFEAMMEHDEKSTEQTQTIAGLEATLLEKESQAQELAEQVAALNDKLGQQQTELASVSAELKNRDGYVSELEQRVAKTSEDHSSALNAHQSASAELTSAKGDAAQEIEKLESELQSTIADTQDKRDKLSGLEQQIHETKALMDEALQAKDAEHAKAMQENASTYLTQLEAIETEHVSALEATREQIRSKEADSATAKLERTLAERSDALKQAEADKVDLASTVAEAQEQLEAARSQSSPCDLDAKEQLERTVAKRDESLLQAEAEKIALESAVEQLQTQLRAASSAAPMSPLRSANPGTPAEVERALALERQRNAELLSKIQEVKGNIQVLCRFRPTWSDERQAMQVVDALQTDEAGFYDKRSKTWRSFRFDRVLGDHEGQMSVFQEVEPLALSVIDGFNACIFAYGQTGSGKTHTMQGSADQHGLQYNLLHKIFELADIRGKIWTGAEDDAVEGRGVTFKIFVAMMEIYNEEVRDLLVSTSSDEKKQALELRGGKDGGIRVVNLVREVVRSLDDIQAIFERGNSNRAVAATNVHEHSSRSHSILQVEVESQGISGETSHGRLSLVDLAGSERISKSEVQGKELKEAQHINKSLSALGDVMEALDSKSKHIPYRNSKLTYLLQDSLGGNSKTYMIANVCPTSLNAEESLFTLQFASRVRRISLGPAKKNNYLHQKNLEEDLKVLRKDFHDMNRKKESAEEALSSAKREQKRGLEKMSTVLDARSRSVEDIKRGLQAQNEVLKRTNQVHETSVCLRKQYLTPRNRR
jgi:kinesin family protein C2/C3